MRRYRPSRRSPGWILAMLTRRDGFRRCATRQAAWPQSPADPVAADTTSGSRLRDASHTGSDTTPGPPYPRLPLARPCRRRSAERFPIWIAALVAGLVVIAVVVSVVAINALQKGRGETIDVSVSGSVVRPSPTPTPTPDSPSPTTRTTCAPTFQPTSAPHALITPHPQAMRWR